MLAPLPNLVVEPCKALPRLILGMIWNWLSFAARRMCPPTDQPRSGAPEYHWCGVVRSTQDESCVVFLGLQYLLGRSSKFAAKSTPDEDTLFGKSLSALRGQRQWILSPLAIAGFVMLSLLANAEEPRRPGNDDELKFWLESMLVQHGYNPAEVTVATGLSAIQVAEATKRFGIDSKARSKRGANAPLLVLPYPGGRHPRIGFLEGAIDPQRETKISIFAPWSDGNYAVADIPEAIWNRPQAGRELLYLAHTHVPTMWSKQGVALERLEWQRTDDGWQVERKLPNNVIFGTRVQPVPDHVALSMWITNGSSQTLRGLTVQNCVMLKGLSGFEQQTNDNKVFRSPLAACHNADKSRWIITGWQRCQRAWGNAPCPCLHSDPQFPDCEPGQTVRLRGFVSFFEGTEIEAELDRIAAGAWLSDD
jgi:hypothetical protein